jgi:hypothetical protein
MKITSEYLVVAGLIVYIAFFTHPPPAFVSLMLKSPVGQVLVLLGVVGIFMKNQPVGLLAGVAYLASSYPVLEYLDASEQGPPKVKEQPKSGAAKPDIKGKLESILQGTKGLMAGKGEKLPQEKGKDVKAPPPPTTTVKPHTDPKVTEKFSLF